MKTISRPTMDHSSCLDAVVEDRSHGDGSYLADTYSGASVLPREICYTLWRAFRSVRFVAQAHPSVPSGSLGVEKVGVSPCSQTVLAEVGCSIDGRCWCRRLLALTRWRACAVRAPRLLLLGFCLCLAPANAEAIGRGSLLTFLGGGPHCGGWRCFGCSFAALFTQDSGSHSVRNGFLVY